MNIVNGKEKIYKIVQSLKSNTIYIDKLGSISLRIDKNNILFLPYVENRNITLDDVCLISTNNSRTYQACRNSKDIAIHKSIYISKKKVNAIIHTFSTGMMQKSTDLEIIPPILDDMAQTIGPTINVANNSHNSILKSLKGRTAVLINNNGGICTGRSLYEAFVACQVLEKTCKVYMEAKKIGGAKPINMLVAYIMHQFYLRVYSKKRTN